MQHEIDAASQGQGARLECRLSRRRAHEIDVWIRGVMPDLHPIVKRLDELFREKIPGLHYAIEWKQAYYGLPERGWVIEMVAYDVSVNVVFIGSADFDSPPPLGSSGRSRYVKVVTVEDAEAPELRAWIEQARRMPGWARIRCRDVANPARR